MSAFAQLVSDKVDEYVQLRRSLGYTFQKQAATLGHFRRYTAENGCAGPLTRELALAFALSRDITPNGRARPAPPRRP